MSKTYRRNYDDWDDHSKDIKKSDFKKMRDKRKEKENSSWFNKSADDDQDTSHTNSRVFRRK